MVSRLVGCWALVGLACVLSAAHAKAAIEAEQTEDGEASLQAEEVPALVEETLDEAWKTASSGSRALPLFRRLGLGALAVLLSLSAFSLILWRRQADEVEAKEMQKLEAAPTERDMVLKTADALLALEDHFRFRIGTVVLDILPVLTDEFKEFVASIPEEELDAVREDFAAKLEGLFLPRGFPDSEFKLVGFDYVLGKKLLLRVGYLDAV
ncbi:hypothetical protein Efla_006115 [Eimeria flavescens]